MAWLYQLLWPLFEACSGPQAVTLHGVSHVQVFQNGALLFSAPQASVALHVCASATMNLLLFLSVVGVAVLAYGLLWAVWWLFSPAPELSLAFMADETFQQLDEASEEYLRRFRG